MSKTEVDFSSRLVRPNVLKIRPYKPGKPIEEVQRELGLTEIVKLASNENPLGPSKKAVEAIRGHLHELHLYPDGDCYLLKKKLAERFSAPMQNVMTGSGSCELIELIGRVLLSPGDEVICAEPTFIMYRIVATACGAYVVDVPLKDYRHDLPAMADMIRPRTKIVCIANPNNPSGTLVKQEAVDEFMSRVPDDVVVIMDEAYFEYITDGTFPDTMKFFRAGRNIAILRTFSKIHGLAGLRVGYGLAPAWLVDCFERLRMPFHVNSVAQVAALAALSDEDHVEQSQRTNDAGKRYLYKELSEMGLEYVPTSANFILMDVGGDCAELYDKLLRQGVIVRPMAAWGYKTKLRVTIGTQDQNEKFIAALKRALK
ncbi:MAG: histidinol-phosphate transaminase [Candidatus Coatesbacteria bacterium]|nr:histidinol-phosphate transaminase [Candidatus Coatesbacteria bacterium]